MKKKKFVHFMYAMTCRRQMYTHVIRVCAQNERQKPATKHIFSCRLLYMNKI